MTWGSGAWEFWRDLTSPGADRQGSDLDGPWALLEDAVARYADDEDAALFAPHITEIAVELADRRDDVPPGRRDQYLQLMGLYHASRWSCLPDGVDGDDLDAARGYFAELERTSPAMVPDAFRTDASSSSTTHGSPEVLEDVLLEWHLAHQQAQQSGRESDLRASASIAQRLLECPYEDPDEGAFAALCAALSFSDLGDRGDADARSADVAAGREAVRRSTSRGEHRTDALGRLGNALLDRHNETGSRADLDELIAVSHELVAACPPQDHENLRIAHGELGECYRMRAALTGSADDFESTISQHRLALGHTPESHEDHSMYVINLVSALVDRGSDAGSLGHVHEAVALADRLARVPMADDHRSYIRHRVVAKTFAALAFETDDVALTDRALEHHRLAVEVSSRLGADEAEARVVLAAALLDAYGRLLPDEPDLDGHSPVRPDVAALVPPAARARLEEAIAANAAVLRTDAPRATRYLAHSNLGLTLRSRFVLDGRRADLDEALRHAEVALGFDDLDDAFRWTALSTLASCLRSRYAVDGDPGHARRACECWSTIAGNPVHGLDGQLVAALSWTETALTARLDPQLALDGAEAAVDLFTRIAAPGTTRADAERRLARWNHVAGQAAEAALRAGRPERAVELLEQGRAVLWNALLDTRADLHEVRRARPDLVDELIERRAVVASLRAPAPGETDSSRAEALIVAGRQLDACLAAIRAAGFPGIGLPPRAADLREHARRGPVAIISTTPHGSHALLVEPAGVDVIDLPDLSFDDALSWTGRYLDALYAEQPDEATLTAAHAWMWHAIAGPVLDRLPARTDPSGAGLPRLWWCPTGPLSLLPLHAAASADGSVMDRVVSSYTATVRSLPRHHSPSFDAGQALFIGLGRTPGADDLAGVADERASLQEVLGHAAVTLIEDEQADHATVTGAWTRHSVIHFSGHGVQLSDAPSTGGLLLHDGVLTVAELADLTTTGGSVAMLSACQTATGGTVNPDEAIAVASALQYGGWETVLGTLWPVRDRVATRVSRTVHRAVFGPEALSPHLAMHRAARDQRARYPDQPSVWAPFVHIGV